MSDVHVFLGTAAVTGGTRAQSGKGSANVSDEEEGRRDGRGKAGEEGVCMQRERICITGKHDRENMCVEKRKGRE